METTTSQPKATLPPQDPSGPPGDRLPKLCGADLELGNFIQGLDRPTGTGPQSARLLLYTIRGVDADPRMMAPLAREPDSDSVEGKAYGARGESFSRHTDQDWGRKFLLNGGCVYIDLHHLELCIPEVLSAFDHLAHTHALFRVTSEAMRRINEQLEGDCKVVVLANNSDGLGNAYGTHLNFLITRRTWEDLFHRRIQLQLALAAYQVSSIVFTGLGKVGTENGQPWVPYQLSQRADFFEILSGPQTTFDRPLINSRDESLCGPAFSWDGTPSAGASLARLHVIFYDNNLCHTAAVLKVGVMQILLALMEAQQFNGHLLLDHPLEALRRYSHDPTLQATARLVTGQDLTAVELQWAFFEQAQRFVDHGGCDGIVPDARQILELWGDTLRLLEQRNVQALTRRIDWVLKQAILQQALEQRPELDWTSPEIKWLDHLYSHLDPREGLYWAYERAHLVDRLVSDERILQAATHAPEETRAWTRALLLQQAPPQSVQFIDWDRLKFRLEDPTRDSGFRNVDLVLGHPLRFSRAQVEPLLPQAGTFEDLLDAFRPLSSDAIRGSELPSVPTSPSSNSTYGYTPTSSR